MFKRGYLKKIYNRISRRIVNRIQKYYRVLNWGLGVINLRKNPIGQKSRDTVSHIPIFTYCVAYSIFHKLIIPPAYTTSIYARMKRILQQFFLHIHIQAMSCCSGYFLGYRLLLFTRVSSFLMKILFWGPVTLQ
jgi:hypothetical protein